MIYIGSDHAGFKLKTSIIEYLKNKGFEYNDVGIYTEMSVDYPDFAEKVALSVSGNIESKGIIVCGTGIGVSIAANKVKGIRAALCTNSFMAKMSRQHNDSNVLALGERVTGLDLSIDIVETWLNTEFLGARHYNRVCKISQIEEKTLKSPTLAAKSTVSNLKILEHPLIQHKISLLRDKNTHVKEFRELVAEVSMLMGYEVTRDMPLKEIEIETPLGIAKTKVISGKKLGFVPILRAGLGMLDGIINLLPMATVGHIGLYRDPNTLDAVKYYCKLPDDVSEREIVLLEPIIATGSSSSMAISYLKEYGVKSIKLMNLISAKPGIEKLSKLHPDVEIYTAVIDDELDNNGYIIPGLGDAGDRLYGTK